MIHNLLAGSVRYDSENQRAPDCPRNHSEVQKRAADYESHALEADELCHEIHAAFENQSPKLTEAYFTKIHAHLFSPSFRLTRRYGKYMAFSCDSVRGVPPFFSILDSFK